MDVIVKEVLTELPWLWSEVVGKIVPIAFAIAFEEHSAPPRNVEEWAPIELGQPPL